MRDGRHLGAWEGAFEPEPGRLQEPTHRSSGAPLAGERRLLFAVLEDAVTTYRRHARARDRSGRHAFEEARAWVASRDQGSVFSYESICDALDIDPTWLRRLLGVTPTPPAVGGTRPRAPHPAG